MEECILIDAQLSPSLAKWITDKFNYSCYSLHFLGFQNFTDEEIFLEARKMNARILTKDIDFLELQKRLGAPPKVIWVRIGNTSNKAMKEALSAQLIDAMEILKTSSLVEVI